ncbi:MAG: hypothetical protein Q9M34_01860, partial [Sulfurimonas sp.]|nr:hypothetical protein [Sulfurimonas sp.]
GNFSNATTNLINIRDMQTREYTQTINLSPGKYFVQVISKEVNNPNNYQISYGNVLLNGEYIFGVVTFEVP